MSNNVPASVRQRPTNRAKETDRPFQELLQYFAIERCFFANESLPDSLWPLTQSCGTLRCCLG